jgi:hypothetical protein
MKKQHGFINLDDWDKAFIICLIIAMSTGYGILRSVEWFFANYSIEAKAK